MKLKITIKNITKFKTEFTLVYFYLTANSTNMYILQKIKLDFNLHIFLHFCYFITDILLKITISININCYNFFEISCIFKVFNSQ